MEFDYLQRKKLTPVLCPCICLPLNLRDLDPESVLVCRAVQRSHTADYINASRAISVQVCLPVVACIAPP